MSVAAVTGGGEGPLSDILTNTTFEGCESHDYNNYDTEYKRQTARERGGGNDSFIQCLFSMREKHKKYQ